MHFNSKYIFKGDSKNEITGKINYNFDQITSFAVGPDGHPGPKGTTGSPGPAGKKGPFGATGTRGSMWFSQSTEPGSSVSLIWDKWIDRSTTLNVVKEYGPTGSWVNTGFNLFSSTYFSSYENIIGPAGVTDKSVVAFANTGILNPYGEVNTSLVISDNTPGTNDSNPNRSKFLILTSDQTSNPIFSFVKTTNVTSLTPSFYWKSLGSSSSLLFRSSGSLSINSLLGLSVDSYTSRTLMFGNSMSISAGSGISIKDSSDFILASNTTIGSGSFFSVTARNLEFTSSYFTFNEPVEISNGITGAFALDSTKNLSNLNSSLGVTIDTNPNTGSFFEFYDSNSAKIFTTRTKRGIESGDFTQTIFGSTGGIAPGGTAGPYLYHVKRIKEIRITNSGPLSCMKQFYPSSNASLPPQQASLFFDSVNPIADISQPSLWDSNYIMITPVGGTGSIGGTGSSMYIYIPTSSEPITPLFYSNQGNSYRVFINDIDSTHSAPNGDSKILGLVWDYIEFGSGGSTKRVRYYLNFPPSRDTNTGAYKGYGCSYVDLFWSPLTSLQNGNPKVFWKTCTGAAGYLNVTNRFPIGSIQPPVSGSGSGTTTSGGKISGVNWFPFNE